MNLIYLATPKYGGWVSFTAHLSLKHNLPVFKIGKRNEKSYRPFGYGVQYKNIAITSIPTFCIIVAVDKSHYSTLKHFPDGTWIVIHDPSEVKKELIEHLRRFRIITIRNSVKQFLKDYHNLESLFLLHPFFPYHIQDTSGTSAVSIARIDFDKHTDIILKANQILPETEQIALHGFVNKRYAYFKLGSLPFIQSYRGTFPKTFDALNIILKDAKYCVDMSVIQHDGGGTQYTFLEAIYQNVALIINKRWIGEHDTPFIHNHNCIVVEDSEELAYIIRQDASTDDIVRCAKRILEPHINVNWLENLV
jgi:hypothetical protein